MIRLTILVATLLLVGCPSKTEETPQPESTTETKKPTKLAVPTKVDEKKADEEPINDTVEEPQTSEFKIHRFAKDDLDKEMKVEGVILKEGLSWNDKNGSNYVVFSREPNAGDKDGVIVLYATHFALSEEGETKTLREVKQRATCDEGDLSGDFKPASFGVTDLDKDGLGEATFSYAYTCTTDVSPRAYKLLMIENGDKYILRGSTQINPGDGWVGGEYKADEAFKGHEGFLNHAKTVWKRTKREKF